MATKARKSPYRGPKKQKDASTVAGENLYKRYVLDSLTEEEREGLNKLNPVERETIVTALADAMAAEPASRLRTATAAKVRRIGNPFWLAADLARQWVWWQTVTCA